MLPNGNINFYINHAIWSGTELTDCNVCIAMYIIIIGPDSVGVYSLFVSFVTLFVIGPDSVGVYSLFVIGPDSVGVYSLFVSFVCLFVCLSVSLSVCPSVCLTFFSAML